MLVKSARRHLVGAGRVVLGYGDELLQRVRVLGQARERAHEPAVAHAALPDDVGGSRQD